MQKTNDSNPYSSTEALENYLESIINISRSNSYNIANIPVKKEYESVAKDIIEKMGYKTLSKYSGMVTVKL